MTGLGVFGQLADAIAPFVGGADVAGFILGAAFIVVLTIVIVWALGRETMQGYGLFAVMGTLYVIVVLVEWWPKWSAIFLVVIIAAGYYFSQRSGGGGMV